MSLFKSKHSGWTWDLKRTPFGGGNPISGVTDAISNAIGTSGNGGLVSGISNLIEQGAEKVGDTAVGLDKAVNKLTPMGWALPAAIVAAYFTGGGSLAAEGAAEAGSAAALEAGASSAATAAGEAAFSEAVAAGATEAAATEAANAAAAEAAAGYTSAATEAGASQFTPEMIQYANASSDPIGTLTKLQGLTPEEFSSVTQYIGGPATADSFTAGGDLSQLMQSYPDLSQTQLEDILRINYGTDPMLSADAANLAKSGYDAATIDQVLGYSYSPTELAGTGINSSALDAASSSSLSDTLKNINRARQLAKLLNQTPGQVNYKIPSSQDWLKNAQTVALNQPAQQQFGGLYQMNKSPFTFQNPTAALLAGGNKTPAGLDVSGQQGTTLNTQQQNQIYSSLLRS